MSFGEFLLGLVPSSAIGAFAEGDVIPVLFFSVMFAFGLLALGPKGKPMVDGIQMVAEVLFKIIGFVMYVAPIGAFGAIAFTVGNSDRHRCSRSESRRRVLCLLRLFVVLVLGPIAWWFGVSLIKLIRYIAAELMIVVGTSSSKSVFPRLNAKLRQLGVDEPIVALVLPSGYAFNHDGTCLYFATVSVFLAQAVGIELRCRQQLGCSRSCCSRRRAARASRAPRSSCSPRRSRR